MCLYKVINVHTKEGNHGQSAMFDLCFLQSEHLLWITRGKIQRIEVSSWITTLLRIEFCVPVELSPTNQQHLNPDQLGNAEGQVQSKIGSPIIQNILASILPDVTGQLEHSIGYLTMGCQSQLQKQSIQEWQAYTIVHE